MARGRGSQKVIPGTLTFHTNHEFNHEAVPSCPVPNSPLENTVQQLEWCQPLDPSSFSEASPTKTARIIRSASYLRQKRETKPYSRSTSGASILQKMDTNSQLQHSHTALATFPSDTPSSNTSQLDSLPSVSHQIPRQSSPQYPTSDVNFLFPIDTVIEPVLKLLLEKCSEQGSDLMASVAPADDHRYPVSQNPYYRI